MPYIPKKKTPKPNKTPNYIKRRKIYQSKKWQELRNAHFIANPLCYICSLMNRVKSGEDVHHLRHLEDLDGAELEYEAYNPLNIITVCKTCHQKLHSEWRNINTLEGIKKAVDNLNNKANKK